MVNIPDSWTIEGFRDIASLNSWKATADMLRTRRSPGRCCRCFARSQGTMLVRRFSGDDGQQCWILSSGSQALDQSPLQLRGQCGGCAERSNSILVVWKHMLRLRKEHRDVLVSCRFEMYNMEHLNVFTYVKSFVDMKILVVLNFSK